MIEFTFKTDDESQEFCESIVSEMVQLFEIDRDEAIGRVNRLWSGLELGGEEELIYHEDEEYWANSIYYGHDSHWWNNPEGLKPLPYP